MKKSKYRCDLVKEYCRIMGMGQKTPSKIKPKFGTIDRVIFNDPATIVFWEDGSKTLVKCSGDDVFDKEQGFFMACFLKATGMTKTKAAKFLKTMKEVESGEAN